MKKIYFALVVALTLAGLSISCSDDEPAVFGSVYGIVCDASTGEPVKAAEVILSSGNQTTITGSDGHYEFSNLPAGQYKITIMAEGYVTNSRQITISPGLAAVGDISINKQTVSSKISLSTRTLNFGTTHSSLVFNISNIGTAGSVDWSVSIVDAKWLSIDPLSGSTDMGKSSAISASIDRSGLTESQTGVLLVYADGESLEINVFVGVEGSDPAPTPEGHLSTSTLSFGKTATSMSFDILNVGSGKLSWYLSEINKSWLSATPMVGETSAGTSSRISILVDRSKLSANSTAEILVNAGGKQMKVAVSVEVESGSGGGGGGENPSEDYSSAIVNTCDNRIAAKIESCRRSGSSVVFTYSLTNTGMGKTIQDFRVYAVGPTTYSQVSDDTGHTYTYADAKFLFAGSSPSGSSIISSSLPEGVKRTGTITLSNVSKSAAKLYISVYCVAYPQSNYNLAGQEVTFNNVPIY